jgi:hypothetical protein
LTEEERRQLLAEKARIADEIRHYPMPIPRCDAQYNHFVERRAEIERALAGKTDA